MAPKGKVGSNAVIHAHGKAPRRKIVATRVEGALHVGELPDSRNILGIHIFLLGERT